MATRKSNKHLNLALGQRIRTQRENLGMTRKVLAECIDRTEHFLTNIELGKQGPSLDTLTKLAKALYTTTDYILLGRTDFTDITSIEAMISNMEPELLEGLEYQIKSYLVAVNYIKKVKTEESI